MHCGLCKVNILDTYSLILFLWAGISRIFLQVRVCKRKLLYWIFIKNVKAPFIQTTATGERFFSIEMNSTLNTAKTQQTNNIATSRVMDGKFQRGY